MTILSEGMPLTLLALLWVRLPEVHGARCFAGTSSVGGTRIGASIAFVALHHGTAQLPDSVDIPDC